jgi:tetratricopeptide (TPR) repeat protein
MNLFTMNGSQLLVQFLMKGESRMKLFKSFVVFSLLFPLVLLHAGMIETDNPERKASSKIFMTENIYKKFVKYQEMAFGDGKEYEKALSGLENLLNRRTHDFEKATIEMFMGRIESDQGHHIKAANHYNKAIVSGGLSSAPHFHIMQLLAKSLIVGGKYKEGIDVLHAYYSLTDSIEDKTLVMEADAQVQLKEYDKAISLSQEPQEKWNYHLYLLYVTQAQNDKASKVLGTLRSIDPGNKDYWIM